MRIKINKLLHTRVLLASARAGAELDKQQYWEGGGRDGVSAAPVRARSTEEAAARQDVADDLEVAAAAREQEGARVAVRRE